MPHNNLSTALKELKQCDPAIQLLSLAWVHRSLKQRIAQLNLAKLSYCEQGHEDAWQYLRNDAGTDLATVEEAIETLCPAPSLPSWI